MSYHAQFESNLSLSGANADTRIPIDPSTQKKVVADIYSRLTGLPYKTELDSELSNKVEKNC